MPSEEETENKLKPSIDKTSYGLLDHVKGNVNEDHFILNMGPQLIL